MSCEYKFEMPPQSTETATPDQRVVLEKALTQVGFVPNMYACMVNSPGLLNTYLDGYSAFREHGGFTPPEQEVVFLVISRENACTYCVAAHSTLADVASRLDPGVTDAIRANAAIQDGKLDALARFTQVMVSSRGMPGRDDVMAFLEAGYAERHVLDIILAIAVKTLSNYSNHLFHTPVDEMFQARRWTPVRRPE